MSHTILLKKVPLSEIYRCRSSNYVERSCRFSSLKSKQKQNLKKNNELWFVKETTVTFNIERYFQSTFKVLLSKKFTIRQYQQNEDYYTNISQRKHCKRYTRSTFNADKKIFLTLFYDQIFSSALIYDRQSNHFILILTTKH